MYHGERFNSISHLIGATLALAALVRVVALALTAKAGLITHSAHDAS